MSAHILLSSCISWIISLKAGTVEQLSQFWRADPILWSYTVKNLNLSVQSVLLELT